MPVSYLSCSLRKDKCPLDTENRRYFYITLVENDLKNDEIIPQLKSF